MKAKKIKVPFLLFHSSVWILLDSFLCTYVRGYIYKKIMKSGFLNINRAHISHVLPLASFYFRNLYFFLSNIYILKNPKDWKKWKLFLTCSLCLNHSVFPGGNQHYHFLCSYPERFFAHTTFSPLKKLPNYSTLYIFICILLFKKLNISWRLLISRWNLPFF